MASNTDSTKTQSAPKSDPIPTFDPFATWAQSQHMFQQAISDALGRAHALAEQYGAMEAQMVARAQGAVASWAQLTQDTIAYAARLSAEARKLGLEAVRKAGAPA
jgi:hypothetical protein